ncbi:MAG: alpha/beta fold hydrolase [Rubrivivax sp.]
MAWIFGGVVAAVLLAAGCSAFDEQQSRWVFQPAQNSWNGGRGADGIDDVRVSFRSKETGSAIELHALWLPQPAADAPLMLYLHGARWDVRSSASRMRRMHAMGFGVLGIDYRGFGQSTDEVPTESRVAEDAQAAWDWLGAQHRGAPRYLYGHSLGSAIAVRLADEVPADSKPKGLILEGAFPSIPALLSSFRYGWLPLGPLVTQRFDAASRITDLHMPVLMLHGGSDTLVVPSLGKALFERASEPKRFVLVDGGSHHNASGRAAAEVQRAVAELFGLRAAPGQ